MYLFVDPISRPAALILIQDGRVFSSEKRDIAGQETELFFVWVEDFLAQYSISFDDLEWIGCVVGPGGFTAMRIVTLTLNTIAYVKNIPLFSWSYFDLADISWVREPILIKANRWEYLLRSKQGVSPLFFPIAEIPVGQYFWVGDQKDFENKKIIIQSVLDDEKIASVLSFLAPVSRLHPYYIKKPNITPSC